MQTPYVAAFRPSRRLPVEIRSVIARARFKIDRPIVDSYPPCNNGMLGTRLDTFSRHLTGRTWSASRIWRLFARPPPVVAFPLAPFVGVYFPLDLNGYNTAGKSGSDLATMKARQHQHQRRAMRHCSIPQFDATCVDLQPAGL